MKFTKTQIYLIAFIAFGVLAFIPNDKGQITTLATASIAFYVLAWAESRTNV